MTRLDKLPTRAPKGFEKDTIKLKSVKLCAELAELQNVLYAEGRYKVLVVLQGMDASGKDGTVKSIFKGVNPAGIRVKSFKSPTPEEKSHNFLWRIYREIPASGMIQVFNRSHYEDLLFPGVHKLITPAIMKRRMEQINSFEDALTDDNTVLFKFYLHISKKEQSKRLRDRITLPEKKWKYDPSDLKESRLWNNYMDLYQHIFRKCGKSHPWEIIPADQNWF
ncbi:MAG TPA: PPK2 family polyphosphate kinase, partial [Flavobacteriales bacterium]|nr:PPK2 family polyphosphate kinase [Flavobacteriales bacterium]